MKHRDSLNNALARILSGDPKSLLLGEDIADPYGGAFKVTKGLSAKFPARVINTPISEASLSGLATGIALRGLHPILEIMFSDFLTLCADQIINHAGKFQSMFPGVEQVPLVVRAPMGGYRGYGPTHSQSMERLFFGTPDLNVVAPSAFHDSGALLEAAHSSRQLTLFMEHKLLYGASLPELGSNGRYQGFRLMRSGLASANEVVTLTPCEPGEAPMVSVLTYGGMAAMVFNAAREMLIEEEITCDVVVLSQIQPVPMEPIVQSIKRSGRALIVEEGHLSWGWGAEVAARLGRDCFSALRAPVQRVAAKDKPIPCARHLEDAVLPQQSQISKAILDLTESSKSRV
jgi:pyruvate/2-oxoglutarate/acetoin dehydrogenase E1 component